MFLFIVSRKVVMKKLIIIALLISVYGCGGGGESTPPLTPNAAPSATAGDNQTVNENTLVTLSGSATDNDGSISSYKWSQIKGTTVVLIDASTDTILFTSPEVFSTETLVFELIVTDNDGAKASSTVEVIVQQVNKPPVASAISVVSDLTTPYLQLQLIGDDTDGDVINYVLESSFSGEGYTSAFIENGKSILYITLDNNESHKVTLSYRVTDGKMFSESASVIIEFGEVTDSGTGANTISPEDYSKLPSAYYDGTNYNNEYNQNILPEYVDLSGRMPVPGNQLSQNSCVGWAVGYALKSYQEGIEEQWSLNIKNTQFSPAWIYNQINNGQDNGSSINDALKLVVNKGAATLSTMPYSQYNFTALPSPLAIEEAIRYKAVGYKKIDSIKAIKSALVNRQPVVIGLELYTSFNKLLGDSSVYSSIGTKLGGHAVTIVGYDDNKFGGALKVINSWGRFWGDNGYFWLPYSEFSNISVAYVLIDGNNNGSLDEIKIPLAPARTELANLQIDSWSINYHAQAGGNGSLQYSVTNSGNAVVPEGVNIGLFLSKDEVLNSSDVYVAFEEVPFEIPAGTGVYRDEINQLPFIFPDNIEAGTYYMGLLIDDLNDVEESNEQDNISWGNRNIDVEASNLADLSVDYWWLTWDQSGDAMLEYSVSNIGTAATSSTGWGVTIVAHENIIPNQGSFYYIFNEATPHILNPNHNVYRDVNNAASFNILKDINNISLPVGNYYISFFVDLLEIVPESNNNNNSSTSYTALEVTQSASYTTSFSRSNATSKTIYKAKPAKAFNGKHISSSKVAMKKVEIIVDIKGQRKIKVLDDNVSTKVVSRSRKQPVELKLSVDKENNISKVLTKNMESRDMKIFPTSAYKAMPSKEH